MSSQPPPEEPNQPLPWVAILVTLSMALTGLSLYLGHLSRMATLRSMQIQNQIRMQQPLQRGR